MTLPRFARDLLIFFVSVFLTASSLFRRSDPARSTRFKFPIETSCLALCVPIKRIRVTECDLDDLKNKSYIRTCAILVSLSVNRIGTHNGETYRSFNCITPTARFSCAIRSHSYNSSGLCISSIRKLLTYKS